VTGIDVAAVALERAATAAITANATVDWICGDIATIDPPLRGYDFVSVHYPALRRDVANSVSGLSTSLHRFRMALGIRLRPRITA